MPRSVRDVVNQSNVKSLSFTQVPDLKHLSD